MLHEVFHIQPQVFKTSHPPVCVSVCHGSELKKSVVNAFLETVVDDAIGVAPSYGSKCVLGTIAFSSLSQVLLVHLSTSRASRQLRARRSGKAVKCSLLEDILCHQGSTKYAFKMDRLASALHLDLDIHITDGVDLLSVAKGDRHSVAALMTALGGEVTLNKAEVSMLFKDDEIGSDIRATATQAWLSCYVAQLQHMSRRFANVARINTQVMNIKVS